MDDSLKRAIQNDEKIIQMQQFNGDIAFNSGNILDSTKVQGRQLPNFIIDEKNKENNDQEVNLSVDYEDENLINQNEQKYQKRQKNKYLIYWQLLKQCQLPQISLYKFECIEYKCPITEKGNFFPCIDQWISPNILNFWVQLLQVSIPIYLAIISIHIIKINTYFSYIPIVQTSFKILTFYEQNPSFAKINPLDISVALQILFLVLLLLEICLTLYIFICYKLLKLAFKKNRKLGIGISFFIVLTIYSIYNKIMNSCNGWEKGLTGQIDFSTEYCYIEKPQYACFQSIFDGLLDFSSKDQCDIKDLNKYRNDLINKWFYTNFQSQVSEERMQMLKNGQVNVLGFPNTAQYTQQDRYPNGMAKRLVNRTQFLENVDQGKQQNIEVMLDLQNMDIVYNLQRNETLVNERIKKQSKDSMSDNIIIIYIDDLSRVQAHRKLKETLKFFDKYAIKPGMSDKKKQKIYDLGKRVFEFYRFHVVGQQTQPILFRLAYGIKLQKQKHKPPKNKKDMIFQHFKDMGYIVGFSSNTCTLWCLHRSKIMRNDVNESPPDHEYYSTVFDPTYTDPKDYFSIFQGPNSIYRRCLYGYDTNYHVLNYGYQFMQTYKNDKKVLYLEFTDSHELTDEVVKYLDTNLRNFLDDLENNNHISKKTTIYLVSDHGQHLKRIVYFTDLIRKRFEQERSLPALFILQTTDVFEQNEQLELNLEKNEQALFSVEQLRNTWITNVQSMDQINNDLAKNNQQDQLFGKMDLYKQCSDLDLEDKPSDHLCQCFEDFEQMEILNNM